MSEATWYDAATEERVIGYGLRRGNLRLHLTSQKVGGPGAIVITALCRGIQPLVWCAGESVDMSDEQAARKFLRSRVRLELTDPLTILDPLDLARLCPRCEARHEVLLARTMAALVS